MTAQEVLKSIGTCEPARKWVGCKSIKTAWAKCERGDWLAWVCGKMLDRRELVDELLALQNLADCVRRLHQIRSCFTSFQ